MIKTCSVGLSNCNRIQCFDSKTSKFSRSSVTLFTVFIRCCSASYFFQRRKGVKESCLIHRTIEDVLAEVDPGLLKYATDPKTLNTLI